MESGVNALAQGFTLEACSSFVAAVERSVEFALRAWNNERFKIENLMRRHVPPRPEDRTYEMPENRIISLGDDHFDSLGARTEKQQVDLSLEDANLGLRMAEIARINAALLPGAPAFSDNFILDIDLDYFNTAKSITPDHRSVFYDLIRRCIGITIAMESYYVIRKTWAYQQRHCNRVPVELLQEALGHSSGQITLAYA